MDKLEHTFTFGKIMEKSSNEWTALSKPINEK